MINTVGVHLYEKSKVKFIGTENRMEVIRGWEEREK